jgi:hypothetical protein
MLEDHHLSAIRDCLFNIFAVTFYLGGRSSFHNPKARRAVSREFHLSREQTVQHLYFYVEWTSRSHYIYALLPWRHNRIIGHIAVYTLLSSDENSIMIREYGSSYSASLLDKLIRREYEKRERTFLCWHQQD